MKSSQKERILDYMKRGRSLTPIDALNIFGCFRLSAVIFDLKKEGHPIQMELVKNQNNKNYAKYTLQSYDGQLNL
mgnify:CR=1 FL=1